MAEPPAHPSGDAATPRWVKVSAALAVAVLLFVVVLLVVGGGDHGPGRHADGHWVEVGEHRMRV